MAELLDIPEISGNVTSEMPSATGSAKSEMPRASGNVRGVRGESAYEVAVRQGYTGTEEEWLASLKGDPGQDGDDGFSPTVSITNITGGHRVTITDKLGTHTVDVMDGEDGHSPVISATKSGTITTITADGTVIATINDGNDGQDGEDGITPSFSIGTVQSGQSADATITGTDVNPVLNLTLPKGDPGDDYVLTSADKAEIAGLVLDALPTAESEGF